MSFEIPAQLVTREHVLVWTFSLSLTFLLMISTYLIPAVRRGGFYSQAWVRAAIAIAAFSLGTMLRAGWVTTLLVEYTHTGHNHIADETWIIDVIAGVISVVGLLCLHREFAPDGYGVRWALAALTFAAVVDAIVWLI